jgi:hypothetical protein
VSTFDTKQCDERELAVMNSRQSAQIMRLRGLITDFLPHLPAEQQGRVRKAMKEISA